MEVYVHDCCHFCKEGLFYKKFSSGLAFHTDSLIPRPSPSIFVYWKHSTSEGVNGLGMRLHRDTCAYRTLSYCKRKPLRDSMTPNSRWGSNKITCTVILNDVCMQSHIYLFLHGKLLLCTFNVSCCASCMKGVWPSELPVIMPLYTTTCLYMSIYAYMTMQPYWQYWQMWTCLSHSSV